MSRADRTSRLHRSQLAGVLFAALFPLAALAGDTQAPKLVSLKVLAPTTINVADPPAAATVRLTVTDDDTGLGEYFVGWWSPNQMQYRYEYDQSEQPVRNGTVDLTAPQFSMYSQPGTWSIYNVRVCDRAENCRSYDGPAIDALTTRRTVEVLNNRDPDEGLPSASAGEVATPTVSLAGNRTVRTRMRLDDAISGVQSVTACFSSPGGTQSLCTNGSYSYAAKGTQQYQEGHLEASAQTGTWTVIAVHVHDVPGNERLYSSTEELDALFPGGRTVTVSP
jgi:hypothetical protein